MSEKVDWTKVEHPPDPHHSATGDWHCYKCKRPLKGSFMRPTIPWEHKPERPPMTEKQVEMPGLATTE